MVTGKLDVRDAGSRLPVEAAPDTEWSDETGTADQEGRCMTTDTGEKGLETLIMRT